MSDGGWFDRPGSRVFNLYRAPNCALGDPEKAGPWLAQHLERLRRRDCVAHRAMAGASPTGAHRRN